MSKGNMINKYKKRVDNSKYFHLDDVMEYFIEKKELKEDFTTLCYVINFLYFQKKLITSKLFTKEIEKVLKLYSAKNKVSSGLEKLLNELWKNIKDGKVNESVITLELFVGSKINKEIKTLVITTVNNDLVGDNKNTFLFNENMRDCGAHIRHSLQKNNIGGCNLMFLGLDNKDITNLMEGFVLSMYQFKKYKTELGAKGIKYHPYSQILEINKTKKTKKRIEVHKGGVVEKKTKKQMSGKVDRKGDGKGDGNVKDMVKNVSIYVLHLCLIDKNNKMELKKMVEEMLIITRNIHMCQDLINEPGNKINPASFVEFMKSYISINKLPLTLRVLDETELKKIGMNLLVSVGQGSIPEMRSRLVILEYNGNVRKGNGNVRKGNGNVRKKNGNVRKGEKVVIDNVLIGKGVTQDIGGINLKSGSSIPEMKTDKAGVCVVFALMSALSKIGIKKNIIGLLPIAENSIGPEATIPGDIIKGYNGMNVEIVDTDGEGRLMMADCLSYAQDKWSDAMCVDISTLTMDVEQMSCKEFSSVIGLNTEKEIGDIVKNGEDIGERVVKFPFLRGKMEKELKSDVADIRNVVRRCKGQLYPSTTFLAHFVNKGTKWIHIDLGGNTYKRERGYSYPEEEGVGIGIKLLMGLF